MSRVINRPAQTGLTWGLADELGSDYLGGYRGLGGRVSVRYPQSAKRHPDNFASSRSAG